MNEIDGLLALGAIAGGFVRGFSGFGGPMVLIPLLNVFYPPAIALWIMALVDLPPNVYLIPTAWPHATAKIFAPLIIGTLLTLAIGAYALIMVDALLMRRMICVAIILACAVLLGGWMYRGRLGTGGWLVIGAVSGLVAGATMIAVVTSLFLNAASRNAEANRANFIIWGFVTGATMALLLGRHQIATAPLLPSIVLLIICYFVGCVIGTVAHRRYKSRYVRQLTLMLIILVAASSLAGSYGVFG